VKLYEFAYKVNMIFLWMPVRVWLGCTTNCTGFSFLPM